MREGAKQRLVGATLAVVLAVIFVPMLFEDGQRAGLPALPGALPEAPAFDPRVKSEVFLGPGDSGVGGLDDADLTDSQPLALPSGGDPGPVGEADGPPPEVPPETEAPPPETGDEGGEGVAGPGPAAGTAGVGESPSSPGKGARDGMPSWVIQVASVATPEGAAALEGKLRSSGFQAFVEKAQVNGKLYYRVRVGPEVDRARAEQTAARLRERHKLETLIKGYP